MRKPWSLVELDLQVRDAAALALAGFECEEEFAAVRLDAAQLVELGVEARRNDAPVADRRRGFVGDRTDEQVDRALRHVERRCQLGEQGPLRSGERGMQLGEAHETVAQCGEIPRTGAAQCDASGDAVDVGDAAQRRAHLFENPRAPAETRRAGLDSDQLADGDMPRAGQRTVAQRVMQRMPQPARAHARDAEIQQRQQRR